MLSSSRPHKSSGNDYLAKALASSLFPRTQASKDFVSQNAKKAKKNIENALNADDDVFKQISEASKASASLECDTDIENYSTVCDQLSAAMIAFVASLEEKKAPAALNGGGGGEEDTCAGKAEDVCENDDNCMWKRKMSKCVPRMPWK